MEPEASSSAAPDLAVPVADQQQSVDKSLDKKQKKAATKAQKRRASEFADALSSVQAQHEVDMQQAGAAGQLAKQRRKALREVLKAVSDMSSPLEDRMQLLQARFVALVHDQLRQDKEVLDLQAQLDAARRDGEAGCAELTRSQQKLDSLQRLARSLTADNKVLQEEVQTRKQHTEKMHGLLQGVQNSISAQQEETSKVMEHNEALIAENKQLREQLSNTHNIIEELRQAQEQRIQSLAEKLQEQAGLADHAQKAHDTISTLMKERELLVLKAAAADELKAHNELLQKSVSASKQQHIEHQQQMRELQDSLKTASSFMQTFEKLKKQMDAQQKFVAELLQERQGLQSKLERQQQQDRDLADKLRRTQLQKQRLESLCRTLQERASGGAASSSSQQQQDTTFGTEEAGVELADITGPAAGSGSSRDGDAAVLAGDLQAEGAEVCHRVVQAAVDAVVQRHADASTA